MFHYDCEGNALVLRYSTAKKHGHKAYSIDKGLLGCVFRNRQPVKVDDIRKDWRYDDDRGDSVYHYMAVPVVSNDRTIGVIECLNHEPDSELRYPFPESAITLLKSVALR